MPQLLSRRQSVKKTPQTGTIRDVVSGGDINAAINASSPGDTVLIHAGTYAKILVAKASSSPGIEVRAANGEQVTIAGVHFSGGTSSWLKFRGIKIETGLFVDDNDAAIRFVDLATDITFEECTISNSRHGLRDDIAIALSPTRILIRRCDIYGHFVDNLQFQRGTDVTIEDNWSHDVQIDPAGGLHNDALQIISGTNYVVRRNRMFCKVVNNYASTPNQGIIAGGNPAPDDKKIDGLLINSNLVHHWDGSGIIMAGADNCTIISNTAYDEGFSAGGQGLTISLNSDPTDLSNDNLVIANNVGEPMVVTSGATRPFPVETNNNFRSGGGGANLITADPLFRDTRSYVPTFGILNNGHAAYAQDDIFGRQRKSTPDRGCYESLGQYIDVVMSDTPVAWWRMSEQVTSFLFEVSGWYPGLYKGAGGMTPRQGSPVANAFSVLFNGSTGYAEVPWADEINSDVFSVETWAQPTGGAGTLRGVLSSRDTTTGYQIEATTGNVWGAQLGDGVSTPTAVVSSDPATLNVWHHLVLTFDGTDALLYVDAGTPTTTAVTFVQNTTQALRVGCGGTTAAANFFPGYIADTIVYPQVLDASRVTAHFDAADNT